MGGGPGAASAADRCLALGHSAEQAWELRASSGRPHLSERRTAAAPAGCSTRVSEVRGPGVSGWVQGTRSVPEPDKGSGARRVGWLRAAEDTGEFAVASAQTLGLGREPERASLPGHGLCRAFGFTQCLP